MTFNGGTTMVDRSVLDALADIMLHLIRKAVDHGVEGLLSLPDDFDGWARSVARLHEDGDLRKRLSRSAKRRASAFDWDQVGRTMISRLRG